MNGKNEIEILKLKEIIDALIDSNANLSFRLTELYSRNAELTKRISSLETLAVVNHGSTKCCNAKY